jgi:hypothetical protein
MMHAIIIPFYSVAAVVIYFFVGNLVQAPALNSASPLVSKIAWGLAMPSVIIAGVINGSIAIKQIYSWIWRDAMKKEEVISERSFRAIGSWAAINLVIWIFAWLIAEVIPSFHLLLAVVSALFMGFFSYGFSSFQWFHLMKHSGGMFKTKRRVALFILNVFILIVGVLICVVGLWATITELAKGGGGAIFTCGASSGGGVQVE